MKTSIDGQTHWSVTLSVSNSFNDEFKEVRKVWADTPEDAIAMAASDSKAMNVVGATVAEAP